METGGYDACACAGPSVRRCLRRRAHGLCAVSGERGSFSSLPQHAGPTRDGPPRGARLGVVDQPAESAVADDQLSCPLCDMQVPLRAESRIDERRALRHVFLHSPEADLERSGWKQEANPASFPNDAPPRAAKERPFPWHGRPNIGGRRYTCRPSDTWRGARVSRRRGRPVANRASSSRGAGLGNPLLRKTAVRAVLA